MSILDTAVASALAITPKFVVGRVARRYIAGETLDQAIDTVVRLNAKGIRATLDVLGEFIERMDEARETTAQYRRGIDAIAERDVDTGVSVKLTAFGLLIDEEECTELVRGLATRAAEVKRFVRIDMEDSPCTEKTLRVLERLHAEGLPVGGVLQAYMRRTCDDAQRLVDQGISVRLCKGIYREPPDVAFQERDEIRENYRSALTVLLRGPARVGIATHDEVLVDAARVLLRELEVPKERYEFQMLLGVREWLRDELVAEGYRLRVYVPYGPSWYAYSVRRLRENPAIAGHVFRAMLGRK